MFTYVDNFYSAQYCTQTVIMLPMFGQFFVYVFSHQATYLRYIEQHILSSLVIYYIYHTTTFPAHLTIYLGDESKHVVLLASFELSRFVSVILFD